MAGLRKKGESFVLCFRVGTAIYNRAVGTDSDIADAAKRRVEAFLLELKRGRRRLPEGLTREQVGTWVLSDGELTDVAVLIAANLDKATLLLPDMRTLMERIEHLVGGASPEDRRPMLAMYWMFNRHKGIEIIEWPGGEVQQIDLSVPPEVFKALEKGRVTIPLKKSADLAAIAGLPWGSIVTVQSGTQKMWVISGPATCQGGGWVLPVFWYYLDPDTEIAEIEDQAAELRRS